MITKYFKKGILRLALVAMPALAAGFLQSCSDNDPFFAASENDAPRILNTGLQSFTEDGSIAIIETIYRNENFVYGIIATPRAYTTINWYVDDKLVFTGDTINMPFLAGTYKIKIEAVTTKGKSTYRERLLLVTPLDGDPTLANDEKSRWLNPGATVTINGNNLDNVSNLLIGGVEVENFINNGTSVTFTVPASLALGSPQMTAITKDGEKFGLDRANVTNEQYVDPGVQEIKLWEGSQVINWGDANVNISADELAAVPVGTKIRIYYDVPEAEYHAMRICGPWWDGDLVEQFDITGDTPNPYEFEYTAECKGIVDEQGGMLIVGFGYTITKVVYVVSAPAETTIWEGSTTINWGDSNVNIAPELLEGAEGKTICLYYDVPEAEYHAMRICGPWWDGDLVEQFDITDETPNPYEFEYTAECKGIVDEQGGMLVVGFGYTLTKITIK